MLDIVCPGPKSDSGMAFIPVAFPISIVTAIVSPTARPNPRMDAPISPVFAYGNIASRNISHLVAPSMYAASRCCCGTAIKTSRDTAETVGIIIMASTTLAVSMSRPSGVPEKNQTLSPNISFNGFSIYSRK